MDRAYLALERFGRVDAKNTLNQFLGRTTLARGISQLDQQICGTLEVLSTRRSLIQNRHCLIELVYRQVCIPHRGFKRSMAKQLVDVGQRDTARNELCSVGMA